MNSPLVSIVIPVYNGSNYLKEAIESAINQTYQNIEVIVVNDGSDDNGATKNIAKAYKEKIIYLEKENGGVASALNLGIRSMSGDLFSWLSHDDVYTHDKIKAQVDFWYKCNDPNVIIYSQEKVINSIGEIIRNRDISTINKKPFLKSLMKSRYIGGCSLLIPKVNFESYGFFNEMLRTTQDYDLWYRFIINGVNFVFLPDFLSYSRDHFEQDSKNLSEIALAEQDNLLADTILLTFEKKYMWNSERYELFSIYLDLSLDFYKENCKLAFKIARKVAFRYFFNTSLIHNIIKSFYYVKRLCIFFLKKLKRYFKIH